MTEDEAITLIQEGKGFLGDDELEPFRDNPAVVMAAIKEWPWAIEHASKRLKDTVEVVLAALEREDYALLFASKRLQKLCKGRSHTESIEALKKLQLYEDLSSTTQEKEIKKTSKKSNRIKI